MDMTQLGNQEAQALSRIAGSSAMNDSTKRQSKEADAAVGPSASSEDGQICLTSTLR
jgi:hypothetical protein